MFYLYCGCASGGAAVAKDANPILVIFSYVNWGMCWFVGIFELCGPRDEKASLPAEHAPQHVQGSYSAPQDPSLSINITPAQAGAAAAWASRNTGTVAAVASVAANSSTSTNPRSDNPFFAQNRA